MLCAAQEGALTLRLMTLFFDALGKLHPMENVLVPFFPSLITKTMEFLRTSKVSTPPFPQKTPQNCCDTAVHVSRYVVDLLNDKYHGSSRWACWNQDYWPRLLLSPDYPVAWAKPYYVLEPMLRGGRLSKAT